MAINSYLFGSMRCDNSPGRAWAWATPPILLFTFPCVCAQSTFHHLCFMLMRGSRTIEREHHSLLSRENTRCHTHTHRPKKPTQNNAVSSHSAYDYIMCVRKDSLRCVRVVKLPLCDMCTRVQVRVLIHGCVREPHEPHEPHEPPGIANIEPPSRPIKCNVERVGCYALSRTRDRNQYVNVYLFVHDEYSRRDAHISESDAGSHR